MTSWLIDVAIRQQDVGEHPAQHTMALHGQTVCMGSGTRLEGGGVQVRGQRVGDHHEEGGIGTGVLEADGVVDPFIRVELPHIGIAAAGVGQFVVGVIGACDGHAMFCAVVGRIGFHVHHGHHSAGFQLHPKEVDVRRHLEPRPERAITERAQVG